MKKLSLLFFIITLSLHSIPTIPPKTNLLPFLLNVKHQRLHLGCGESHLNGYINIDYPPSDHTVQTKTGADIFGDVTQLILPNRTITEIRSHHFFEHFNRQRAMALLSLWHNALQIGGTLYIETPDFEQSIHMLVNTQYSYLDKQKILRHIFGSHEAFWAYHYDGWYKEKFQHILNALGFSITAINKSSYLLTHNITVIATKNIHYSPEQLQSISHGILKEHTINNSPDEEKMWGVWCKEFDAHFFPFIA